VSARFGWFRSRQNFCRRFLYGHRPTLAIVETRRNFETDHFIIVQTFSIYATHGFSKSPAKPVHQKTRYISAQFSAVQSEDFHNHRNLSLKFIQILQMIRAPIGQCSHFLSLFATI